jgi:hypothetical protein
MKKLALVISILLVNLDCSAQFSFGVKGGVNASNIVIKDLPTNQNYDPESLIGIHLGVLASVSLSERFSFIPELQYSQRGTKYIDNGFSGTIKINYLDLPLVASYSFRSIAIDFGSQISTRLSSSVDAYKDFDFGLIGGLRFNLGNNFFTLGRYYYGLAVISEIKYMDLFGNTLATAKMYNRSFQIGMGYKIK